MLLDTFAVTGGKPNASSVGKVMSVPEPTTALMAPAATPARAMARISYQGTGRPYSREPAARRPVCPWARPGPARAPAPAFPASARRLGVDRAQPVRPGGRARRHRPRPDP